MYYIDETISGIVRKVSLPIRGNVSTKEVKKWNV
jgi:hypothetical protein